ncbi:MAG: T9SS type A sorting domain-containing protein, partial [Ignavibacteria bacterium]|nr:T9SS type A sorting domain-containing protein [Ignavibacteria bacterium]
PFNPTTNIVYSIPKSGIVTIKIYNILGQEVRVLANRMMNPGTYNVSFDASSLNSGVYFYSLTVDNFTQVKKMMLLK